MIVCDYVAFKVLIFQVISDVLLLRVQALYSKSEPYFDMIPPMTPILFDAEQSISVILHILLAIKILCGIGFAIQVPIALDGALTPSHL